MFKRFLLGIIVTLALFLVMAIAFSPSLLFCYFVKDTTLQNIVFFINIVVTCALMFAFDEDW